MQVVGHRGAKGLALENTAASVEAALRYGVDMVEVDLRLSRDGVVVLLHDTNPVARNGLIIKANDYTYAQLLDYFPDLLTLDNLLKLVDRRCKIMLEFKETVAITPAIKILKKYLNQGYPPSDLMFASFKQSILLELHRKLPDIPVVVTESWSSVRAVLRARQLGTKNLCMDQRYLWWGVIRGLSKNYNLYCYPCHKLIHIKHAKPNKWAKFGLYGVITDRPDFFLKKKSDIVNSNESKLPSRRDNRQPEHKNVLVREAR